MDDVLPTDARFPDVACASPATPVDHDPPGPATSTCLYPTRSGECRARVAMADEVGTHGRQKEMDARSRRDSVPTRRPRHQPPGVSSSLPLRARHREQAVISGALASLRSPLARSSNARPEFRPPPRWRSCPRVSALARTSAMLKTHACRSVVLPPPAAPCAQMSNSIYPLIHAALCCGPIRTFSSSLSRGPPQSDPFCSAGPSVAVIDEPPADAQGP